MFPRSKPECEKAQAHNISRCCNAIRGLKIICLVLPLLFSSSCAQEMMNQKRVDPQEATAAWGNRSSMRALPAHTVPAKESIMDQMGGPHATLWQARAPAEEILPPDKIDESNLPDIPATLNDSHNLLETVQRGQNRFQIWCTPCHGQLGNGNGEVARRGYYYPASFHTPRLRAKSLGYFFEVITQGKKHMPAYRFMIPPDDRWAIAVYLRALQFSQHAPESMLTETDLNQLKTKP